ncbi:MAG: orotate phosphoribosyltransferase [Pseudomonadota bacterium]
MHDYQREFVALALESGALKFGDFTLKSGRQSPYFFNAGQLSSGRAAAALGRFYANVIHGHYSDYDVIFGPAYKGIPLAALSAAALSDQHGVDVAYAFNRKEAKTHGEGGNVVGAALKGNVIIVDDVITAGTAIRESVQMIRAAGANVAGIVISLDRQEKGQGALSAVQEVEQATGVKVSAIATLQDLVTVLGQERALAAHLGDVQAYQARYSISGS